MRKMYIIVTVLFFMKGLVFASPMEWSDLYNCVWMTEIQGEQEVDLYENSQEISKVRIRLSQGLVPSFFLYYGFDDNGVDSSLDGRIGVQSTGWEGLSLINFNDKTLDFSWALDDVAFLNKMKLMEITKISLPNNFFLEEPKFYNNSAKTDADEIKRIITHNSATKYHAAMLSDPSTMILLASGILGLVWFINKRKKT